MKSSFQKLQETKTKLDRAYENACGMLKAEAVGSLSIFDKDIKEFSLKIQQATTDSLNYVDCSNGERNHWNQPTTSDRLEGIFSQKDIPVTSHDNKDDQTQNLSTSATDTLEKSLKLLRDVNQFTVFDKNENLMEIAPRKPGSATLSTVTRRSLVDFSPSRTLPKSDTFKPQGSKVGSDLSRLSERRRLEMNAKLLKQKSQMEIEKKQRELSLETNEETNGNGDRFRSSQC